MFHFSGNPTCSSRTSDTKARVSVAPDLDAFRDCQNTNARYCAECAGIRSDSDRYAELRKLVEAWQSIANQATKDRLLAWRHQ
mgnify:CR=1 FL=1